MRCHCSLCLSLAAEAHLNSFVNFCLKFSLASREDKARGRCGVCFVSQRRCQWPSWEHARSACRMSCVLTPLPASLTYGPPNLACHVILHFWLSFCQPCHFLLKWFKTAAVFIQSCGKQLLYRPICFLLWPQSFTHSLTQFSNPETHFTKFVYSHLQQHRTIGGATASRFHILCWVEPLGTVASQKPSILDSRLPSQSVSVSSEPYLSHFAYEQWLFCVEDYKGKLEICSC